MPFLFSFMAIEGWLGRRLFKRAGGKKLLNSVKKKKRSKKKRAVYAVIWCI